jgi:hypothetical protein
MAAQKAPIQPAPVEQVQAGGSPLIWRWIKTDCGRAKYAELARHRGPVASLRLGWFVLIAALRDWRLPAPETLRPS